MILPLQDFWYGYWALMRRYHRFEVHHLERLERAGPALIVGYHGRPMAHDLCMLQSLLRDRGQAMPLPIIHGALARLPLFGQLIEAGDFLLGDDATLATAVAAGRQIIVTPGGTREGYRSFRDRYRVNWGERLGYLRLAIKYRLPIIPTAAAGVDDTYIGLNDGYAWGKRLRLPGRLPLWLGLGPLGLFPFSPPYPVRITLHIGEPLQLAEDGLASPAATVPSDAPGDAITNAPGRDRMLALHRRVMTAVQALLDEARGQMGKAAARGASV
jgi:1-acyl-sn-glycerol-3-phosphate acyltransferase